MAARSRSIRSGRFNFEGSVATERKIILGDPRAVYRIFNSGRDSFEVITTRNGGMGNFAVTVELHSKDSFDVEPNDEVKIKVAATKTAEGIYDITGQRQVTVRNGRFDREITGPFDANNAGTFVRMCSLDEGRLYRVFNTAELPETLPASGIPEGSFVVRADGSDSDPILPKQSFDFYAKSAVSIRLPNNSSGPTVVEGIYDRLDAEIPIRSGRFIRLAGHTPTNLYKLIDFPPTYPDKKTAVYRFFNSGENIVRISGAVSVDLSPAQSVDIRVKKNRNVSVEATATGLPIEGIYDFLGIQD